MGKAEIIANMLAKGRSPERVADDTGMPLDEVRRIAQNLNVGN